MADGTVRGRLWSVRLRITLAATLVTGVAVFLASSWLVATVRDSMTDRVQSSASDQLDAIRAQLEAGRDPADLDLPPRTDVMVQVVDGASGAVVAGETGLGVG